MFSCLFELWVSDLSSLFFPLCFQAEAFVDTEPQRLFLLGCRKGLGRAEMNAEQRRGNIALQHPFYRQKASQTCN